ncbi:Uncharacterized protein HZ326_21097 [Fusarium oxysporum f. sp. albedinis]|nr:Uncharacterized protein HZ326_21097 [Fusarium oxysporum f. sp. albedinis]
MTAHAFTLNTSCSKHTRGQWLTDEHYPHAQFRVVEHIGAHSRCGADFGPFNGVRFEGLFILRSQKSLSDSWRVHSPGSKKTLLDIYA